MNKVVPSIWGPGGCTRNSLFIKMSSVIVFIFIVALSSQQMSHQFYRINDNKYNNLIYEANTNKSVAYKLKSQDYNPSVFEDLKCNEYIVDDYWEKMYFGNGIAKRELSEDSYTFENSEKKKPLIFMRDGYDILSATQQQKYTSFKVNTNLGNLIWMYGATSLISLKKNDVRIGNQFQFQQIAKKISERKLAEKDSDILDIMPDLVYFPVANILYNASIGSPNPNTSVHLSDLKNLGRYSMMVGAGAQIGYCKPHTESKTSLGRKIEEDLIQDPKHYLLDNITVSLLNGLDFLSTRGNYTKEVCSLNGAKVKSLGCPSIMISNDVYLGSTIQLKIDALMHKIEKSKSGDKATIKSKRSRLKKDLKILLTLPIGVGINDFLELFMSVFIEYPKSIIVFQDPRDFKVLRFLQHRLKKKFKKSAFDHIIKEYPGEADILERMVCFSSVTDWLSFASTFDMAFGARIHGTMAAISAGIPSLLIAPDYRVQEIGDASFLPTLAYTDPSMNPKYFLDTNGDLSEDPNIDKQPIVDFSIDHAINLMNNLFDAEAFDRNRGSIAIEYVSNLNRLEIYPSDNLIRISSTDYDSYYRHD